MVGRFTVLLFSVLETNNIASQQGAGNNELDEGTTEGQCKEQNKFLGGEWVEIGSYVQMKSAAF